MIEGKNLLATGEVTVDDVIGLLNRCRGDQHETTVNRVGDAPPVHIFKPTGGGEQWYVKAYVIVDVAEDDDSGSDVTVFISVHRSEHPGSGARRLRR